MQTTDSNPLPRAPGRGGTGPGTPPPGGALLRLRPRSLGCRLPGCISVRQAMYLRRAVSKTLALPRRAPSGPVPLGKDGECPAHFRGSRLEPAPRTRQHPVIEAWTRGEGTVEGGSQASTPKFLEILEIGSFPRYASESKLDFLGSSAYPRQVMSLHFLSEDHSCCNY